METKVFDCVFNGVPMARCGPSKAMKTRLSRHHGITAFDCVFNGAVPRTFFEKLLEEGSALTPA